MKSSNFFLTLALACAAITFSLTMHAQAQTVSFLNRTSANSVMQATDGNFYGTGGDGGAYGFGQVFRMTPAGKVGTIYSFCSQANCADGKYPDSAPVLGSDGNLYGAVGYGGNSSGSGTIYKMTLSGEITTLYTFCPNAGCIDGRAPRNLILASDGNFYGTTEAGGKFGVGTIFRISSGGQFKVLHIFCSLTNCVDGENPHFAPIQGSDGNFYGATYAGGALGGGTLYQLTPGGSYQVIYNFCSYGQSGGCPTGSNPETIVQDAAGNFFGMTAFGGDTHNDGTIFELTSDNQYSVLHQFDVVDGTVPNMGLTPAKDGNFYGMTQGGGIKGFGNIFEISASGEFSSLYEFSPSRGYDPFAGPLFQGTDGNLYGTTIYGPTVNVGTIFKLSNGLGPLVETVPVAGKAGQSVLVLGNGLSGTSSVTFNGAAANFTVESDSYIKATVPRGATTGTVSVVTPSGTLKSNPQFVVTK
jgi:uncharacterized repeat protein (TIGR03803 family)